MYNLNDPINRQIIEDINSKNWGVLHTLNDADYCGFCMIAKPVQTRHCPVVNMCIPKYHKYSFFFDKPVFFANQMTYFLLLTFETMSLTLYLLSFFNLIPQTKLEERSFFLRIPWLIYNLGLASQLTNIAAFFIVGYTLMIKLFHFTVMFYVISKGTTLDEIYNPHYYPYLFRESKNIEGKWIYDNPEDRGFLRNWTAFIKQSFKDKLDIVGGLDDF